MTLAAVSRTAKPRHHMAAVTVPPMAKVTPLNKSRDMIPVIDPRLRISSSKVPPLIFMFVDALSNVISSVGALHDVGTILHW